MANTTQVVQPATQRGDLRWRVARLEEAEGSSKVGKAGGQRAGVDEGIAPSCCHRPSRSAMNQRPAILPLAMRYTWISGSVTPFPSYITPITSTVARTSGRIPRTRAMKAFIPSGPRMSPIGVWLMHASSKGSSTVDTRFWLMTSSMYRRTMALFCSDIPWRTARSRWECDGSGSARRSAPPSPRHGGLPSCVLYLKLAADGLHSQVAAVHVFRVEARVAQLEGGLAADMEAVGAVDHHGLGLV